MEDSILIKKEEKEIDYFFRNNSLELETSRSCSEESSNADVEKPNNRRCKPCHCLFSTREIYLRHVELVHTFRCQKCDKIFESEEELKTHNERVHKRVDMENSELNCSKCQFTYPTVISYNRHLAITHQHEVALGPYELKIRQIEAKPDPENPLNYCATCEFTFVRNNDFITHLVRIHNMGLELQRYPLKIHYPNIKPDYDHPYYFCAACEYTFPSKIGFHEHIERIHPTNLRPKEELTPETEYFTNPRDSEADVSYSCAFCDKLFTTKNSLKMHELQHEKQMNTTSNPDNQNHCSSCNLTLSNVRSYRRHLLSLRHKEMKRIVPRIKKTYNKKLDRYCNICKQTFRGMSAYHRHLIYVHKQNIPKPDHLPSYINYDETPVINDPNNYCTACKRTYSCKSKFSTHLKNIHYIGVSPSATLIGDKWMHESVARRRYHCRQCRRYFPDSDKYEAHLKRSHSVRNSVSHSTQMVDLNDPELKCRICNVVYSTKGNFQTHLKRYHPKNINDSATSIHQDTNFIESSKMENFCTICNREFANYSNYKNHMATVHDTTVPYRSRDHSYAQNSGVPDEDDPDNWCSVCKRIYSDKKLFRSHLSKVHGMKLKNTHLAHINLDVVPDITVKDNLCTACNRVYYSRNNLFKHFVNVHRINIPTQQKYSMVYNKQTGKKEVKHWCSTCEKGYMNSTNYQAHLKSVHMINVPETTTSTTRKRPITRPDMDDPNHHCSVCEKTFPNREDYQLHLQDIHSVRLFKKTYVPSYINLNDVPDINNVDNTCTACKRKYSSFHSFRKHIIDIHKLYVPKMKKSSIEKTVNYTNPDMLAKIDVNSPTDTCNACEKTYQSKYSFRQHLITIHQLNLPTYSIKEEPNHPTLDSFMSALSSSSNLPLLKVTKKAANVSSMSHEEKERRKSIKKNRLYEDLSIVGMTVEPRADINPQDCAECGLSCPTPRLLRTHMRYAHKINMPSREKVTDNYEEAPPDMNDPDFWCSVCEKFYFSKYKFDKHMALIHNLDAETGNEVIDNLNVAEAASPVKKPTDNNIASDNWICRVCGASFSDKLLHQIHEAEGHDVKIVPQKRKKQKKQKKQKKRVQWNLPLTHVEETD